MSETMARSMEGREIGIVASAGFSPAAYRFACQLNENSAAFAHPAEVPEMNHNEIVAWSAEGASTRALIAFTSDGMHPRAQARMEWMLGNIVNEVVWRNFSTDTWVSFKVFGFLPMTVIFALAQTPLMHRYAKSGDTT